MRQRSGGLWWSVVVLAAALAACGSQRSNLRLGSLTPSQRSLDYDPGIVSWKLANQLTVAMMPDKRVNWCRWRSATWSARPTSHRGRPGWRTWSST